MSIRLEYLLAQWYPLRDTQQWVLGTITATEGPCYRKAGAMMLFNDLGQQFGLLSGGCLEADIQRSARQVMSTGLPLSLRYDGNDEDDISFRLGIGCGGVVHIYLQAVTASNNYLYLEQVRQALSERKPVLFGQKLVDADGSGSAPGVSAAFLDHQNVDIDIVGIGGERIDADSPLGMFFGSCIRNTCKAELSERADIVSWQGDRWATVLLLPRPSLLVVGGGVDAQPLVAIASQLGWRVTLCDARPANARREHFPSADSIIRDDLSALVRGSATDSLLQSIDALVIMSHNLELDAAALKAGQLSSVRYVGLLGPVPRREQILALAGLSEGTLSVPLSGPAGLDIGGGLPESIALSILAECHAVLAGCDTPVV